jgi:hypothetical protein
MITPLLPLPIFRAFDNAGVPLAGGLLYTYAANTTTPQNTYSDAAGASPNPNPVVLDSTGSATVRLDPTLAYKFVLKDSSGATTLWTEDYYQAPGLTSLLRTAQEVAASVTPSDYSYVPGDLRRYGAVGDGATDDTTAWTNAIATGHRILGGGPQYTYKVTGTMTLSGSFVCDLQGATVKPTGNFVFLNSSQTLDITTTYTGSIAIGARSFTVTSATGIVAGDWCFFQVNLNTEESYSYPPSFAQVTGVVGSTVTVDRAFQVAYPSSPTDATVSFIHDGNWKSTFSLTNGICDGAGSTYNSANQGTLARPAGFRDVIIDNLRLPNWNLLGNSADQCITIVRAINAVVTRVRVSNSQGNSHFLEIFDSVSGEISGCTFDTDSFGPGMTRVDNSLTFGNTVIGRLAQNTANAVSPQRSVRGIKIYGCNYAVVYGNKVTDMQTGIRGQGCSRMLIAANTVVDCATDSGSSNALAIDNITNGAKCTSLSVVDNIVENGGVGISVAASTSIGRNTISRNHIRSMQGYAINVPTANSVVTDNHITDWGLSNTAQEAIHYDSGTTCTGNRFYHASLASLPCMRATLQAGFWYDFADNTAINGNPLFTGSLDIENSGATTIGAASTSQTPTHNLIKTPANSEIYFIQQAQATNDPGQIWVDTVTSTQFTLHVKNAPGGSGVAFGWRAKLKMPFQA